jgi:hypothetical protein
MNDDIKGAALGALGAHSEPAGPNAPHHNTIMRGPRDEIAEQVCFERNQSLRLQLNADASEPDRSGV